MSDKVVGTYTLKKSDNFDNFLKELGMNILKRGAAAVASATVTVSQDGENWIINTNSTFGKTEIKFKLGEEFDEDRLDGAKVKSTITLEGNKMTQVQKGGKNDVIIIREFDDAGMNTVATTNDVSSTRFYARQ
jgi:hypothetical protein